MPHVSEGWCIQNQSILFCTTCLLQVCLQCQRHPCYFGVTDAWLSAFHAWFRLTRQLDKPAGMCALLAWHCKANALRVLQAAEGWPWARWLLRSRLPARAGDHAAVLLRLAPDDALGGAAGSAAHAADSNAERAGLRLLAMLVYTPGARVPPRVASATWLYRRGVPANRNVGPFMVP